MNYQYSFWPEPKKNVMVATVYLVSAKHPWRKIKVVQAHVIQRKFTWAQFKGHRYLLGATAFYTLPSAKRAKVGYLTKLMGRPILARFQPELYYKVKSILESGVIE
jgi:hypothetical protein